jgi:hypothetical protein
MPKMTFYAIRHKPTGGYLPMPRGRGGRGSSFMIPEKVWAVNEHDLCRVPLLCQTSHSAKAVLGQWLRGKHHATHHGDDDMDLTIKYDGKRVREDMEIVKVEFNLP